ncbi:MAG: hypothetical protein R3F61_26170 [Myxococcota bacterium]
MACAPQSAELVDGKMTGFLSSTTSFTLIKGNFDPDDFTSDLDATWNIDCRELEEDAEILSLENPLDVCGGNQWPPANEVWLDLGAYKAFQMPLDTWRGEAIILSEGDLQIGFHQRMPGGEDFRFIFSVDPKFQPKQCNANGEPENRDGDWIAGWSTEIDRLADDPDSPPFLANAANQSRGGKLFFLNSFSFQWDPDADSDTSRPVWTLPEEWRAGYSLGTFVEEDLHIRNNRMADPALHILFEADIGGGIPRDSIYYAQCENGDGIEDCRAWRDVRDETREVAVDVRDQLRLVSPDTAPLEFMPIAHDNGWRKHDAKASGLDGWGELAYSWVMFTPDSELERGGNAHGYFSLVFDGDDSQSRFFVQGEFDVPRIKREKWGGRDLRTEKLEEAGVTLCQ